MVAVFYVCCCLLCAIVCARGSWFLGVGHLLISMISYFGIVLGVSIISTIVLDTYLILVKYLAWENGGREKNDKSVVCVVCCK